MEVWVITLTWVWGIRFVALVLFLLSPPHSWLVLFIRNVVIPAFSLQPVFESLHLEYKLSDVVGDGRRIR
ncbi:hypothetical protein D3C81_1795770 [compost metagenome]